MAFTNYIQQITATNGTTHDLVDTSASHYVKGTQTSSTNAWTGALPDGVTAYYDGLSIDYFLPYAGTSSGATLNLGSKGAKPVYIGNGTSAVTTHFPQYSVIHLTYIINSNLNSGNGCWKATSYYNTNSGGTITGVTAGTGLSGGGTSGAVTLNHSNSITAQTTQAVYPIKIDAQGHISAYGSAVTIPTDTNTWRKVQLEGTDKLGTAISTNPLNFKAGTNVSITESNGTFTFSSTDTNTDTKVTSSANHYTPSTASGNDKTASATGATAAWSIDVVKGITINTDGKGHITGLSVTSGKIPANPDTHNTAYLYAGASNGSANASTTNGNTYLILKDGSSVSSRVKLGSGKGISVTSDASGNVTIQHTHTDITAGTVGTSSATSGSTLAVPYVTYDAQGHITGTGTHTHTISGFSTTDTKVTQAYSTASSSYPILMTATAGVTSTGSRGDTTAILNNGLYYIPSSQTLRAGNSVKINGWTWDGVTTTGHLTLSYTG